MTDKIKKSAVKKKPGKKPAVKEKNSLEPKPSAKGKNVILPDEDWAQTVKPCLEGLNEQQSAFVLEFVKDFSRVRAYRAAYGADLSYYSAAVNAHKLLKDAKIRVAVSVLADETTRAYPCDPSFILAEMSKLAAVNMKDFYVVKGDGTVISDLSMITRDQAGAIQELHTEEFFESVIEDGEIVPRRGQRVKIKLMDRRQVLNDLAKYHKMFNDNFSPRAETATILDNWEADKLTTKEAGIRFAKLGLPLPEVLKIELSRQEPEQPPVADPITPEEMDKRYLEAMAERKRQVEQFVPERRADVVKIKEDLKNTSSFDPENNQGDNFD